MKTSFKYLLPLAAAFVFSACSSSEITRFATTDMTWAEFYSGEIGVPVLEMDQKGYDAVTSATLSKSKRFSQNIVSEDGSTISGVRNVPVGMTESVYRKLSSDPRYTFLEGEALSEYKTVDKKGNFGKLVGAVTKADKAEVKMLSGQSSVWGNYTISVHGAELDGNCLGVVLTCSDGSKVGLKSLDNVWIRKSELAFCVAEFTEPHGNKPTYRHTEDLVGKTITNITYLFSGAPAVSIDTDLLVKKTCSAVVSVASSELSGNTVTATFSNLPDGYKVGSIRKGIGRSMRTLLDMEYSFSDGKLSIGCDQAKDMYMITFESEEYSDLSTLLDLTR